MSARHLPRARSGQGAQRQPRDVCTCILCTRAALASCNATQDAQGSSKAAGTVVALRSATVPARDPAIAEVKRGPRRIRAVDSVGDRHALRGTEDEDKTRAHHLAGRERRRGGKGTTR